MRAEVAEAQLNLHLIPVKWIRVRMEDGIYVRVAQSFTRATKNNTTHISLPFEGNNTTHISLPFEENNTTHISLALEGKQHNTLLPCALNF